MLNKIEVFLQEGKKMLDSNNVDDYDRWKHAILFFVERNGTATMIEKVKKEVNKNALFVTYVGDQTDLGPTFHNHKLNQIKKISGLLQSLSPYLIPSKTAKTCRRNTTRKFSKSIKNHIWDKQQGKCLRCDNQLTPSYTEYDHKTPWEDGGLSTEENCQAFCANCHKVKTNEDRMAKQKLE